MNINSCIYPNLDFSHEGTTLSSSYVAFSNFRHPRISDYPTSTPIVINNLPFTFNCEVGFIVKGLETQSERIEKLKRAIEAHINPQSHADKNGRALQNVKVTKFDKIIENNNGQVYYVKMTLSHAVNYENCDKFTLTLLGRPLEILLIKNLDDKLAYFRDLEKRMDSIPIISNDFNTNIISTPPLDSSNSVDSAKVDTHSAIIPLDLDNTNNDWNYDLCW